MRAWRDESFPDLPPGLAVVDNRMLGVGADGRALLIQELTADGEQATPAQLRQAIAAARHPLQ